MTKDRKPCQGKLQYPEMVIVRSPDGIEKHMLRTKRPDGCFDYMEASPPPEITADERERIRKADLTNPGNVAPLTRKQKYIAWTDSLSLQAQVNDDAALLIFLFKTEYSRKHPEEKLSHHEALILSRLLVDFSNEYKSIELISIADEIIRKYNREGIPLPMPLRDFDRRGYAKRGKGRPKGRTAQAQNLEYVRKIYRERKKIGCFPLEKLSIETIPYDLSRKIDRLLETDFGYCKHINKLANQEIYKGYDSLRKSYLEFRRYLVIEDLSDCCFKFWFD